MKTHSFQINDRVSYVDAKCETRFGVVMEVPDDCDLLWIRKDESAKMLTAFMSDQLTRIES